MNSPQQTETIRYPKWTSDQIKKKADKHQYIRAGQKTNQLVLSGAEARWKSEFNEVREGKKNSDDITIYIPSIRLAGSPQEILNLLTANQINNSDLYTDASTFFYAEAGKRYYTYSNISQSQPQYDAAARADYEQELRRLSAYQSSHKGCQSVFCLEHLDYIHETIKSAKPAKKTTGKKGVRRATSPGRRGGQRKSLVSRIEEVLSPDHKQNGRFIDVDSMTPDGGSAKFVNAPKSGKSKKVMANDPNAPPIISSSGTKYRAAMRLLDLENYQGGNGINANYADMYERGSTRVAGVNGAGAPAPVRAARSRKSRTPGGTQVVPNTESVLPSQRPVLPNINQGNFGLPGQSNMQKVGNTFIPASLSGSPTRNIPTIPNMGQPTIPNMGQSNMQRVGNTYIPESLSGSPTRNIPTIGSPSGVQKNQRR